MRKLLISVSLVMIAAGTPAHAQVPVTDGGNLIAQAKNLPPALPRRPPCTSRTRSVITASGLMPESLSGFARRARNCESVALAAAG